MGGVVLNLSTCYIFRCTGNCKPQGGNYNDKAQASIHVRRRRVYVKFTSTVALSSSFPYKIITRNAPELLHAKQYGKSFIKNPEVAADIPDLLMIGRHTLPIHHLSLFGYAVSLLLLG